MTINEMIAKIDGLTDEISEIIELLRENQKEDNPLLTIDEHQIVVQWLQIGLRNAERAGDYLAG